MPASGWPVRASEQLEPAVALTPSCRRVHAGEGRPRSASVGGLGNGTSAAPGNARSRWRTTEKRTRAAEPLATVGYWVLPTLSRSASRPTKPYSPLAMAGTGFPLTDGARSALDRTEPGQARERRLGALPLGSTNGKRNSGVSVRPINSIEAALWATHPAWGKAHLTSRLPRHRYPIRRRIATERVVKFVPRAR
jgi:hypothetical protein